jgi:hypothetical protein
MGDHTETTEIDFDPSIISYDEVREGNGQGRIYYALPLTDVAPHPALHGCRFSTCFGRNTTPRATTAAGSESITIPSSFASFDRQNCDSTIFCAMGV